MGHEPKPLYRKVNTTARGVIHDSGGDFRHDRNAKASQKTDAARGTMHGTKRRGLDYTPLFRFLLSSVGKNWEQVYGEAVARLDRKEPIFWLVALRKNDGEPVVRVGESTYFSGLFVDDDHTLQIVDPSITIDTMAPLCACCTHTFNGAPFIRRFARSRSAFGE
jgi:hypothetical protein